MLLTTACLTLALGFAADASLPTPVPIPEAKMVEGPNDADCTRIDYRKFMLPITVEPNRRAGIASLLLWVSTNEGKTWQKAGEVKPDAAGFAFFAPRDGLYWFKVQVVGKDKTREPDDITKGPVGQRVLVDTRSTILKKAN